MNNLHRVTSSQHGLAAFLDNRMTILTLTTVDGSGNLCAYCHRRIDPLSLEQRMQAIVSGGPRTLHFHKVCHHLWESHAEERSDGSISTHAAANYLD